MKSCHEHPFKKNSYVCSSYIYFCLLSGQLHCFHPWELRKVEQGKGTADHLMPLGDWFFVKQLCSFQGNLQGSGCWIWEFLCLCQGKLLRNLKPFKYCLND